MKCFITAGLMASTLLLACSDEHDPIPATPDAGGDVEAGITDAGRVDVSADVTSERPFDLFDVFPLPDAGCPACIRDRCGAQINACINNPACATGLFCTLQMCAGGVLGGDGGVTPTDFLCILGCFNGDQATAFMAIGSLTCVTMTCAGACSLGDGAVVDVRPPPDGAPDATAEAGADAELDTSAPPDARDHADADAAPPREDVAPDVAPETGDPVDAGTIDSAPDTFGDIAPDTTPDVTPDIELDAAQDATLD